MQQRKITERRKGPQNTRVYAPTHPPRKQSSGKKENAIAYVTDKQWAAMRSGTARISLAELQEKDVPEKPKRKDLSVKTNGKDVRKYQNIHRIEQVEQNLRDKRQPKEPPKRKEKREPVSIKKKLTILLVSVLALGALAAGWFVFLLDTVIVEGLPSDSKYTQENIAELSGLAAGTHMLFIQPQQIKTSIESFPYFEVTAVKKEYPRSIRITARERVEAAAIQSQGFYAVIDVKGHVLSIGSGMELNHLIRVNGMSQHTFTLNQPIGAANDVQAAALKEILQGLEGIGLMEEITEIDVVNPLRSTLITVDGLTVLLGQTAELSEKLTWLRDTLPSMKASSIKTGMLDLSAKGGPTYSPLGTATKRQAGELPQETDPAEAPQPEEPADGPAGTPEDAPEVDVPEPAPEENPISG